MATPLDKEFRYYVDHQAELVKKYGGKVLVISGESVIGAYDSELVALQEASKTLKPGTFLIQRCEPGPESYSQTYHSRVSFA
jgi:hypothetical protein